jgi:hypothetical protein
MKTETIVLVILGISVVLMEISGIWLIKQSNKTSQQSWKLIGKAVCWAAPIIFIVGIFGLWVR